MEMMENLPIVGTVVKSCAGRDRKRVFIVTGITEAADGMRLTVVNGELRKQEKPKTKNPRHVKPIGHLTEEEMLLLAEDGSDETVRTLVQKYDEKRVTSVI